MKLQMLQKKNWALCLDAGEYEGVSLFAMKLYEYVPDSASEKQGFLRVIDEEGEPYYYDARAFRKINARRNGLLIPFAHSTKPRRKGTRTKAYSH
jgi:hypothetical protein